MNNRILTNLYRLNDYLATNHPHRLAILWNFTDDELRTFSSRVNDITVVHAEDHPDWLTPELLADANGYLFWIGKPEDMAALTAISTLSLDKSRIVVGSSDHTLLAGTEYQDSVLRLDQFQDAYIEV
jgi:hypothetical protein